MMVTLDYRGTCALCRFRLRGFYLATVRVNKHTLRTAPSGGLYAIDRTCPECGTDTAMTNERWALDADSQERVDAYRARKGWVTA